MAAKGTKIKTPIGELMYINITGEGKNTAMPGEPARMCFVVSLKLKKDSEEHKAIKGVIDEEWKRYCAETGTKGRPKTTGIKPVMVPKVVDGKPELDEYGATVKVESDEVLVNFSTGTKWASGEPQVVKVFDNKGNDVTVAIQKAPWKIGNGSKGVVHGMASGNSVGGTAKVSLYLSAVQLAKLVKYEGDTIDAEEIEGEDLDLGDDGMSALTPGEGPTL